MCGAGSPFARSTQELAASQPASLPMISTMVTEGMEYTRLSRIISWRVAATYFAAEPNPGVWSVSVTSLSMVFGTPMTRIRISFAVK